MHKKQLFISLGIVSLGIVVSLVIVLQKQQPEVVAGIVSENSVLNTVVNSSVTVKNKGAEIVAKVLGKEVLIKKYKYQDDPDFNLEKLSGLQDSTNVDYRDKFYAMKEDLVIQDLMVNPIEDKALSAVLEYEITYDSMFGIDFPEERRKPLRENHYQMNLSQMENEKLCGEEQIKAKKITIRECVKRAQDTFDTYLIDGHKKFLTDKEFELAFDGKSKDEVQHGYLDFYKMAGILKEE